MDNNSSDSDEYNLNEEYSSVNLYRQRRIDGVVSGKEAVDKVRNLWLEHRRFYRIIFMDCNMPEMDGYETTKKIREFVAQKQKDVAAMKID